MKSAAVTKSKQFYWWAQSAPDHVLKRRGKVPAKVADTLHMLRDSTACLHLAGLLAMLEYRFGGLLYNMPPNVYSDVEIDEALISYLSNEDLILHTTRPALDDHLALSRRTISRSGSQLEGIIYTCMRRFFKYSYRQGIILSDTVKKEIDSNKYDLSYSAIGFHQHSDAYITHRANVDDINDLLADHNLVEESNKTTGYIVHSPNMDSKIHTNTPRLLSIFALNGSMTLLFSYLVLKNCSELIKHIISSEKQRLIVVEFTPEILSSTQQNKKIPIELLFNKMLPVDLSFADSIPYEIKIDVSLNHSTLH